MSDSQVLHFRVLQLAPALIALVSASAFAVSVMELFGYLGQVDVRLMAIVSFQDIVTGAFVYFPQVAFSVGLFMSIGFLSGWAQVRDWGRKGPPPSLKIPYTVASLILIIGIIAPAFGFYFFGWARWLGAMLLLVFYLSHNDRLGWLIRDVGSCFCFPILHRGYLCKFLRS